MNKVICHVAQARVACGVDSDSGDESGEETQMMSTSLFIPRNVMKIIGFLLCRCQYAM